MKKLIFWMLLVASCVAQQVNTDIIPASTGLNLGHQNQRWNAYLHNLDVNGTCTINGLSCLSGFPLQCLDGQTVQFNGTLNKWQCTNITINLSSPPPIGNVTPNIGVFTALTALAPIVSGPCTYIFNSPCPSAIQFNGPDPYCMAGTYDQLEDCVDPSTGFSALGFSPDSKHMYRIFMTDWNNAAPYADGNIWSYNAVRGIPTVVPGASFNSQTGVLTVPSCVGCGTVPGGTLGNPYTSTGTAAATSALFVDGSRLTGANANDWCDKIRKQLSNMSTGQTVTLDMSALSGNQSCAVDPFIDLIGTGMQPAKNLTIKVGSNLNLTTNAPITTVTGVKLLGPGGTLGSNAVSATIAAGSLPATYTTGTATNTASTGGSGSTAFTVVVTMSAPPGASMVAGMQFIACNTGPTLPDYGSSCGATAAANPFSGTIKSVSGSTVTVVTTASVSANASGYNFVAFSPLSMEGDGAGISSQPANFDSEIAGFTFDCNGVAGCVPFYNRNCQNHCSFHNNTLHPSSGQAGFIIDGPQAQQSSFYDNFIVGQTGNCDINTIGGIIRFDTAIAEPFVNNQIVLTQCGTNGVNTGLLVDAPFLWIAGKHFTNSTSAIANSTAIAIATGGTCPIACASQPFSSTGFTIMHSTYASYVTYGVKIGTFTPAGGVAPHAYKLISAGSSSGGQVVDLLNDTNTGCLIPQGQNENPVGKYTVDSLGVIVESTSYVLGCTAKQPSGTDVVLAGGSYEIANNGATGTTINKLACDDGAGKAIICSHTTSTTNTPLGVVIAGAGTTGNAVICTIYTCSVISDNATTAKHWAISSSTVDGDIHDTGATTETAGQPNFFVISANGGAGTAANIKLLTPDSISTNSTCPTCITSAANLTSGHIPKAASTSRIVTDGYAVQGTDSSLLTSGTVSGTGASLCTDANGGATTSGCPAGSVSYQYIYVPNCASTGTTLNKLAKWSNSYAVNNDCAVITATGDNNVGVQLPLIGVVVGGAGTTGNAQIAVSGTGIPCVFDAVAGGIQGGYVGLSTTTAGDCTANANSPANENPNTNYFFATQEVAAVASSTNNIDMTFVPPTFGTVSANDPGYQPPVMTFLGAASYGGARAFPMDLYQSNSTGTSANALSTNDPMNFLYTSASHYTTIGSSTNGASGHDFQIDANSNGLNTNEQVRFNNTAFYSNLMPPSSSATGTVQIFFANGNAWYYQLTGNTTLSSATFGAAQLNPGNVFSFVICQDGTGGRTLTWPAAFINPPSMPAAPSACISGTWETIDSTHLRLLASTPISVIATSQTASITTTTITTPQTESMYKLTATLDCRAVNSGSTVNGTIGWTDPSNTAQTASIPTSTCTTLGSASISSLSTQFRIKSATNITYATTSSGTISYDLSIALETMTQ